MSLFDFAYCGDFKDKLVVLARLCGRPVDGLWEEVGDAFDMALSSGDLVEKPGKNAWFDTGCTSMDGEAVYALFTPNKNNAQPWFLADFVPESELPHGLFDFAFCPGFEEKIGDLASLALPETWSFDGRGDNSILKNYIKHTFMKLWDEDQQGSPGKIVEKDDYAIFNTGLFTRHYEPIYAYFQRNKMEGRQPWFLEGFFSGYELASSGIRVDVRAKRADYFSHPEDLVFDVNSIIIPQYDHILGDEDNRRRLPRALQGSPNASIILDGAIKRAMAMLEADYKTAVPQWYRGRIQLLVPLYLLGEDEPDLCLVVSKDNGRDYIGRTCLTIEMAYNNARLIARPDSNWLCP